MILSCDKKRYTQSISPNLVPRALPSDQTPQANSSQPIVLDVVSCRGGESSLSDCRSATYIEYCGHQHDIGVNCTHVVGEIIQ